ncbi:APH family phosphotransferase [Natrialba magadii ATCC 43099]|uniref:APH family phosphotransferase n=1 Tax=Natrialba magadii (strain ATCC 43099 / DSM 3394 / CCM 3739 / CIP 104546 / IAM 13178 / JCM 8861 / NBRC 102185 / NCIMB 2190 / MS3) TaxID=547559 RepID=D3SV18_NATMM|nr:aminoglycoside phosphotransferase family protein [Natrialba magadii]ADD05426.1 APH family phosphotransferase [Natrialba magadii ATCC 43099]ELY29260.1 aminoglycoside phosphotransferase [Natrialba magadii ATCC 43099]
MESSTVAEQITATALESALDLESPPTVRSCWRPAAGSVAETFVVALETIGDENQRSPAVPERVVCKLGGASVWTGDVIEPLVLGQVSESSSLPVPAVLASGSIEIDSGDGPAHGDRWALYEFRDGQNAGECYHTLGADDRRRLVAQAGAALGSLHSLSERDPRLAFDRVGGLARESDGEVLEWTELKCWHALDPPARLRLALPVPLAGDDGCRPVLTHGDFQPNNLLVTPTGDITAILDWGNAHVTHDEYALARAEVRFVDLHARRFSRAERERLRAEFRRNYAAHATLSDEFDERALHYKLLWALQSGANYARIVRSARGRQQLWRQCQRLLGRETTATP